jgi:hypothetical protein
MTDVKKYIPPHRRSNIATTPYPKSPPKRKESNHRQPGNYKTHLPLLSDLALSGWDAKHALTIPCYSVDRRAWPLKQIELKAGRNIISKPAQSWFDIHSITSTADSRFTLKAIESNKPNCRCMAEELPIVTDIKPDELIGYRSWFVQTFHVDSNHHIYDTISIQSTHPCTLIFNA